MHYYDGFILDLQRLQTSLVDDRESIISILIMILCFNCVTFVVFIFRSQDSKHMIDRKILYFNKNNKQKRQTAQNRHQANIATTVALPSYFLSLTFYLCLCN